MSARIYDLSMLTGLLLLIAGVRLQFGLAPALIVAGAGVIALTALAAVVGGRR